MHKLDRYIRTTVFMAMLLVLLVLGSLDLIFSVFEEIGETTEYYQAMDALTYVLLVFPRHIYELLPMTALIGALVGLGIMASSNELVIMQSAGVKVSRIVWAVMKPTAVVMLLGLGLGEFVAPPLELKGEVGRAIAIAADTDVVLAREGVWQRDGNEYMHFNAIEPSGILHGVSIYEYDDQLLLSNTFASSAEYKEGSDGAYWLLEQGSKTTFSTNEAGEVSTFNKAFNREIWAVDISPDLLKVLIIDTDKMAISDLYRYAARFESQGQDPSTYLLSFWKKVLQPITTAALVLVAISFIFGPLREATMGSRVFTAICFGLGFIMLQRLLSTVSLLFQINPFYAVSMPIAVIALIGFMMLRRAT